MKFSFSRFLVFLVAAALFILHASAQVVEIPDPNLQAAIRKTLELPPDKSITKQDMEQLTRLTAWNRNITDLTGLQHAAFLNHLSLRYNQIQDLTPIANLISLEELMLDRNPISDLIPLSNLVNLRILRLDGCINIADISPLENLVNLERLFIQQTPVTNFTPLQGLNLIEFYYDEPCNMPPIHPPIRHRIENRTFPSVNAMFGSIVNRQDLSDEKRLSLHDLMSARKVNQTLIWDLTPAEPTYGLATQLAGNIDFDISNSQKQLELNPNMIFIRGLEWFSTATLDAFPPDSDFWLRDNNNNILYSQGKYSAPQINFANLQFQDLLVKRIVAIDRCGLDDGVFFDGFFAQATGFIGRGLHPINDKEFINGWRDIFTKVRAQVRDDFLIIVNANRTKLPHYAEFINGTFMETGQDHPNGYTHEGLKEIESTLLWSEQNLRKPQINCLEGWGIGTEPPDSPNNLRWMRVFTSMSLTHSDGYVLYNTGEGNYGGPDHDHLWYSFWDADLGRPVGPKAQLYKGIDGLFIREFTNGWAVYNRSGGMQEISLPESVTGVSSGQTNTTHQLPDLDGEIYLKAQSLADVNRDGKVNVLDLVQVANSLGKSTPDPNGDGVVNILDLVFVAQQFSQ